MRSVTRRREPSRRTEAIPGRPQPAVQSGRVTGVEPQAKHPNRFNLYLDGKFALGLSAMVAARVRVGQELAPDQVTALAQEEEYEAARERALHLLDFRPRSEQEVRRHLARKFTAEAIDRVIVRLREANLLGDPDFAQYWVENREGFKPRSARALKYELKQKGVSPEAMAAALENLDETESAYRAARPKAERYAGLDWRAFQVKVGGFLARRGFDYAVVQEVAKRLYRELHPSSES